MADEQSETNLKLFALRAAQWVGCSGAHKHDGKWMPCETHEELQKLSSAEEPKKKTAIEDLHRRYNSRKAKGRKKKRGWEKLNESKPLGFATLEGGGIVSAPINSTIYSGGIKSYIPNVSPRDNDPDVFTDIESARKRSRMLGCIGVRRMPSATGRTVWMPCTNNTDYARLAGTTFLGRRGQAEANRRVIRTIVRREMRDESRRSNSRQKSLYEEISNKSFLGAAIGGSRSMLRGARRAMGKIEGVLDPLKRRDVDDDGMIFDGTWREMPDPNANVMASGRKKKRGAPEGTLDWWAAETDNRWLTPKKITKGGTLKASELLNYDRLRARTSREEQARVLGVRKETIDAMYEPDASLTPYDADKISLRALNIHPALVWGEAWLESSGPDTNRPRDVVPENERTPLTERDELILNLRGQGKSFREIAKRLNISHQRVAELHNRATSNRERPSLRSGRERNSRVGQIERDERGVPIIEEDKRSSVIKESIKKMRDIGLTEEEINLLFTGDRNTSPETDTPRVGEEELRNARRLASGRAYSRNDYRDLDNEQAEVDIANMPIPTENDVAESDRKRSRYVATGKETSYDRLFSGRKLSSGRGPMTLKEMADSNPDDWPKNQKTHIANWGNSKPSFNVPYSIARKFFTEGDLSAREWKTLLRFYTKYGPERSRFSSGRTTTPNELTNVGAERMIQIILDRVPPVDRSRPPGERTHYNIIGPGGMGKSTLVPYLRENGYLPSDTESAHVDPDFIKYGIEGYNGGAGSASEQMAVHKSSARAATRAVNRAADNGMDIVTEGTGMRLQEYKTTDDSSYKKVVHVAYTPYDKAESRVRERNAKGGRQLPISEIRSKGRGLYETTTSLARNGATVYIWDMDVPIGAAPKVIAKVEDGVFTAFDEPRFKSWSEQHGGFKGGEENLKYYKERFSRKK